MILVSATGKVGAEAARLLAIRGERVRALTRHPARAAALVAAGVEVQPGDLAVPDSIDVAMRGVTAIVLTSPGSDAMLELNVVASALRAGTVTRIVKATSVASADSPVPRQREQACVEAALAASGIGHTLLRSNFYMQNMLMQAPSIAADGAFASSAGGGLMGLVDSRDVADVAATVAAAPAPAGYAVSTLLLTGPALLSYADVAGMLGAVLGRSVTYTTRSVAADIQAMVDAGVPPHVAANNALAVSLIATGSAAWLTDDVAVTLARPPRSFAEFARDHAASFG